MTYEELEQVVTDYFSDKTRTQSETKEDLLAIAENCETLASSLEGDD